MTISNLGTIAIRCPNCGGTQLSKGDTPDTEDIATCGKCGNAFSLQTEIAKIGESVKEGLADALRKSLKG